MDGLGVYWGWVCIGDMQLSDAKFIYENYEVNIRASGHCRNVEPEKESYNPIYDEEIKWNTIMTPHHSPPTKNLLSESTKAL